MENNQLVFIGSIHSELKDLKDCPKQEKENAPTATIEVFAEFAEGLKKYNRVINLFCLRGCTRLTELF